MPVERFFLLLDGHIRVIRTTPGATRSSRCTSLRGSLFGIGAAIGRTTYPATAMTADDCVALAWPNRLWPVFVESYDGFATETYKVVGERVGEMNNRIVELATQQVEQRIACAILRLVTQTGRKVDGGIEIGNADHPAEPVGHDRHHAAHRQPPSQRVGAGRNRDVGTAKITVTAPHRLVMLSGAAG
jgi:CRP/FNR family transcriptional regulator, nitrogen oxide reductase regulator